MNSIAETHPTGPSRFNLRAFLAGGGASTALIAAALITFVIIGTLVAFDALPFGGGGDEGAQVELATPASGAPEAAAAAPGAVAATPAAATAIAPAPGFGASSRSGGGGTPGTAITPGADLIPGGSTDAQDGVLGGTVRGLENTADRLGVDSPPTGESTGPVDSTLNDTLNDVGSAFDHPSLGDEVSKGVNGVTRGLLGDGGATDQLLSN